MSGPPPPFPFLPRPGMPPPGMPMPGMPGMMMPPYGPPPPRPLFPHPMAVPGAMGPPFAPPPLPRPQSVMGPRPPFLSTMARPPPPGGRMMMPPPSVPKPLLPAHERVPKRTTVYVGKIAPSVGDDFVRQLLEACGAMKSWKRVEDPESKQPKGFGFCEYEEADGCQRALRLLSSLKVDGQELLIKPDSSTAKYLEEWGKDKEREAKDKQAKKVAEAEQGELEQEESEEDLDNDVLVKIMGLLSDRAELPAAPSGRGGSAAHEPAGSRMGASANGGGPALPPPPRLDAMTGLPLPPPVRDARTERQIEAARALEAERAKARDLEREFERERERERKEEEGKRREAERAYEARVREWEKAEREIYKAREKERERQKEAEREWQKAVRADLEAADTDDEVEAWARRPYRTSRRAEERRRRRGKEEVEDEEDRLREAQQQAQVAARLEEERQRLAEQQQQGHGEGEGEGEGAGGVKEEEMEDVQQEPAFDPNDPIYQAMVAAAKAPMPIKHDTPTHHRTPTPEPQPQPEPAAAAPQQQPEPAAGSKRTPPHAGGAAKKPNLAAIFGEEEEESDTKRRKLVPIQYTEEEVRAVQSSAPEDPKALLRRIADAIPTTREAVFTYKIKWDAYEADVMGPKLTKWVQGKITELVGLEMPDVVGFIMELLGGHGAPQKMFDEVVPIIDKDAETFVIKLYRMVIFETEKAASGL